MIKFFFYQISIDDLKGSDGLTVLLIFLDSHLAKDDLTDSLEKFEDFDDFHRTQSLLVYEFIATFDAKYRKKGEKEHDFTSRNSIFQAPKKSQHHKGGNTTSVDWHEL